MHRHGFARALALTLLTLLPLGGCSNAIDVEGRVAPIVDGTRELGEPAVVLVLLGGGLGSCTGTLISPRVVLTAKHCVQLQSADSPAPASLFSVGVGDSVENVRLHRVQAALATPGRLFLANGTDIGLLVLRDPITDVEPIAIRRESPEDLVGREVTAIGFGTTREREVGVKYRTTTTIESVTSAVLHARETICAGDSGGPIILESDGARPRQVVGVASYGLARNEDDCPSMLDAWNRIDKHLDLIDLAVLRAGDCVERGEETCNSLDDDCDGTVDEGCAAPGEACETDEDCAYGPLPEGLRDGMPLTAICAEIGGARQCAFPCDPLAPATSCSEVLPAFGTGAVPTPGLYCLATEGCSGLCVRGEAGSRGDGEACSSDTDCASLRCFEGACATPCRGGALACPSDEVCDADVNACGVCVDPDARSGPRSLGEPCDGPEQCGSRGCGPLDGARQCTAVCSRDGDCPAGTRCDGGYCARGARSRRFEACRTDADCVDARCLARGGGRYCATPCTGPSTCPGGTCTAIDGAMLCVPDGPVLGEACDADTPCTLGECHAGICTALCGGASTCPVGYDCVREGTSTVCRPRGSTGGGGCAVSAGDAGRGALLLSIAAGLGLALAIRRRRR